MSADGQYVLWYNTISSTDIARVGGKNASLGELMKHLRPKGIQIMNGFAVSADAYRLFLSHNTLEGLIRESLATIDLNDVSTLTRAGARIREAILSGEMPEEIVHEIERAYEILSAEFGEDFVDVAVRSSATAEDLPDASFAGQQETYLNVRGAHEVIEATKRCFASMFTNRAISYRIDYGFDHLEHSLSVGVQKMVRSDLACSGVMFTIDPESGFDGAVIINGSWGLGELVVQGRVQPDEFQVYKKHLLSGMAGAPAEGGEKVDLTASPLAHALSFRLKPILEKNLGQKEVKMIYNGDGAVSGRGAVKEVVCSQEEEQSFILTDDEVLRLAYWACLIEEHYGRPMDIEWAKDGNSGELYIVQARPETVQSRRDETVLERMILDEKSDVLLKGIAVGSQIGAGRVHVIESPDDMGEFQEGEILVTEITDPDWEPIMKKASGIITNSGGRTSHAAIISREMGIPAVVGTRKATDLLHSGQEVTISCADGEEGIVYEGLLPYHTERTDIDELPKTQTQMMMILGDPDRAFHIARIPNQGVGLARLEFIILNHIQVHPLALLRFDEVQDEAVRTRIEQLTRGYENKAEYFVEKLAEGVAKIAAAFEPEDVVVRLSDFKSNEYASLLGGGQFEPVEENPMIGWRGASRYYAEEYAPAFALECQAIQKARVEMGFQNIKVMIPFCRTPEEGRRVLEQMEQCGLARGKDGLEVYMMCEIPSNVILAEQFAELFDGFSIGSNDLTQLTLGLDRDSAHVAHLYDERNEAVKYMIQSVIETAKRTSTKIGICGQAPSDFPEFTEFLVRCGIDSIALNPDTVLATTLQVAEYEQRFSEES